jgi:hypothetical protein
MKNLMKSLDISLGVWYAESMMTEFTEQELAVISYGLEDHITELTRNLQAIDDVARNGLGNDLVGDLRRAHTQARNETRALLAKVEELLYGTK